MGKQRLATLRMPETVCYLNEDSNNTDVVCHSFCSSGWGTTTAGFEAMDVEEALALCRNLDKNCTFETMPRV